MVLPRVLDFAKQLTAAALYEGGVAVDATVGNGHDTLHLARLVGEGGHVYGYDIQDEALAAARRRLEGAGMSRRVTLQCAGHEHLAAALPPAVHGQVRAAMFNLGYLPGGDKSMTTEPDTTLRALDAAGRVLAPGGVLTVVLYTGHAGGLEEAEAVARWAAGVDEHAFRVVAYRPVNQRSVPQVIAVERLAVPAEAPTGPG
jgi:SAM-dependent methyltransferase